MNKTLLLILCDFLLLNLLALTRWENAEPARPPQDPVPGVGSNAQTMEQDLVAAMKQSLAQEQATREQIAQRLSSVETTLAEKEKSVTTLQAEQSRLSSNLQETQRSAAELAQKMTAATQEATMTKEQLARLQRELDDKRAETERQQQALAALEKQQTEARQRIEGLTVAVQVAAEEKKMLQATAETFKQQAVAEREERERVQATTVQLAQGVGQLAEKSSELRQELIENRPINANVLFSDFLANRVTTRFAGSRPVLLGSGNKESETRTIFVSDGAQVYALLHLDDTPFSFIEPPLDWTRLQIEFTKPPGYRTTASQFQFLSLDPRVIAIPVSPAQVAALGVKVYKTALDPFKFPDAVLISGGGQGYGELAFKLDGNNPGYVQVDNRLVRRLSGQFSPSRGDLVLSKTGELLGIMVNPGYCVVVNNFLPARTINTGEDIKAQNTSAILAEMAARYRALPFRLQ